MISSTYPCRSTRDGVERESELLFALARAVMLLAEHAGLRSFFLPYISEAQCVLDRVVLHCLERGWTPPKSLPELVTWCVQRTLDDELFDSLPSLLTTGARLVDPVGLMPTRTCLELAAAGRTRGAEHDALDMLAALERKCRSAYWFGECRRFLARHPVVSQQDRLAPDWGRAVWKTVRELYEPIPEALVENQVLAVCGTCQLPGRTPNGQRLSGPDTWCEGEWCPSGVRFRLMRSPNQCLILPRALRAFLVTPAPTEQETLDQLECIGADHHLMPGGGLGVYHVAGHGLRTCLVQVCDRRQPALLGGRISGTFAASTDCVMVVVPRRRAEESEYREAFFAGLSSHCKERVTLTAPDGLAQHLRVRPSLTLQG